MDATAAKRRDLPGQLWLRAKHMPKPRRDPTKRVAYRASWCDLDFPDVSVIVCEVTPRRSTATSPAAVGRVYAALLRDRREARHRA